ncbi:hypothetical protein LZ30DRAFT_339144 [Colletotrichum cereale]|nr:hypothetical protein LZ30DRAFT_339144 [Colletotrichum cereale]
MTVSFFIGRPSEKMNRPWVRSLSVLPHHSSTYLLPLYVEYLLHSLTLPFPSVSSTAILYLFCQYYTYQLNPVPPPLKGFSNKVPPGTSFPSVFTVRPLDVKESPASPPSLDLEARAMCSVPQLSPLSSPRPKPGWLVLAGLFSSLLPALGSGLLLAASSERVGKQE